jgi:hypothetical protein
MGTEFDEQALRKMLIEADVGTEGRIDFQDFLRIVVDETRYDEPVREVSCGVWIVVSAGTMSVLWGFSSYRASASRFRTRNPNCPR